MCLIFICPIANQYYLLIVIETIVNDLDTADDKVYWIKKIQCITAKKQKDLQSIKKNKGNNVG